LYNKTRERLQIICISDTNYYKINDHRLKAMGFLAAESRIEAKASLNVLLLKQSKIYN
jgi:hypothetical protein